MASPSRTRTRKTAQVKAQDQPAPISPEEAQMASEQENAIYQQAQMGFLQNRVATLRVELNRANKEIENLKQQIAD